MLADPDRVAQALDNLIANSLRYGDGPVELSVEQTGGGVELHVLDRGSGFGEEFLAHAFERFSRDARGGGGAPGRAWAWPSSRPSPPPTAALLLPATGRAAERTS